MVVCYCFKTGPHSNPEWPGTHYVAHTGLRLTAILLPRFSAGTTGINHYSWPNTMIPKGRKLSFETQLAVIFFPSVEFTFHGKTYDSEHISTVL